MNLSRNARLIRISVAVGAIVGVAACDLFVVDSASEADSAISRTLQDLPRIEAQLPSSLAGDGSAASASIGTAAVGDVDELTVSDLPDVRSQAWYDMRDAAGLDSFTEAFIDELREIGSTRDLSFNTVYTIGERDFLDGRYDLGRLKIGGSESDMTVYWFARPFPGLRFWAKIDIARSGQEWAVTASMNEIFGELSSQSYASFDTATNISLLLSDNVNPDETSGPPSYRELTIAAPNADDSLTLLSATSEGEGWGEMRIGWGDDTMGGVLSIGEEDGEDYASRDFYNGDGSLLIESRGTTDPPSDFSWVEGGGLNLASAGLGLGAPPETVYVFSVWDNVAATGSRYVSVDNSLATGGDNAEMVVEYDVYYKEGAQWEAGDAVYYWNSSSEYNDGDPNTFVWREVYMIGYQVPLAQQVFGGTYYFEDRYPIKHLLPLTGAYAGNSIKREEGETFSGSWQDDEGQEYTWSWTDYRYFIDVNDDDVFNEDGQNPDVRLETVWTNEFWIWDTEALREIKVTAPVVTSSSGRLPGYFGFRSTDQAIVDTVTTRIDTIFNDEFGDLSFEDYRSFLEDLDSLPAFDDVEF